MAAPLSLYIHIPYCPQKCAYCDFNSYAGSILDDQGAYVAALQAEMARYAADPRVVGRPIATVFIGGGTPTLLPSRLLAQVLEQARATFPFAADAEVSVEANPGTVDYAGDKLLAAFTAGANRLSFGVQAFQDRILQRLGRVHSVAEVEQAVATARRAGFCNLNIDLMYGLPDQTLADWQETLERALALAPEHISAYSLIIEEGTAFHVDWERGRLETPDEGAEEEMFHLVRAVLGAAGYEQYEVSNFARSGYRSRHNQVYWRNEEYLGLGAGAHSYLNGERFWNVRLPQTYVRRLTSGQSPVEAGERLDAPGAMAETMMMGLRLLDGVEEARFAARFGRPLGEVYGPVLARLQKDGLLEQAGAAWRLTQRGLRLGNQVWAAFLP